MSAKPQSAIIVVDGSLPMREWIDEIQQALEELGKAMPIEVILARSSSFEGVPKERLQSLSQRDFVGGSDNAPALMHALDLARTMPGKVALLWLHGPQPFEFADTAGLAQLFQRSASAPALQTISLVPGPNRLIEKLYSQTSIQTHGRCMDAQDLRAILRRSLQLDPVSHWSYVRSATAPLDAAAIKVWDHLARMAVFEKVMAGCRIENEFAALGAIAVKHQIVTPVSGAVVLETQQQYDKAGLQPGDPNASPQIPLGTPEPSRVVLLLIGLTLLLLQRRRV
ncbi:MAG: PEP-CTERM sorting domain-containing protein [Verrucomicrobia bacterium]|nr:PEP-CTERM sorting domain-containing protein [Verrucomicrobiota bacterium]